MEDRRYIEVVSDLPSPLCLCVIFLALFGMVFGSLIESGWDTESMLV
jgi:hypothetical protein